ncbi:MAG: hypothetical protein ACK578_01805, partial [Pirellula sp.]
VTGRLMRWRSFTNDVKSLPNAVHDATHPAKPDVPPLPPTPAVLPTPPTETTPPDVPPEA